MDEKSIWIEQIKLKATFFNNMSVGIFVGGYLVPVALGFYHADELARWMQGYRDGTFPDGGFKFLMFFFGFLVAGVFGIICRHFADKTLEQLADADKYFD